MAKIILRDGSILQDFGRPYVVAEINTSHFGNIQLAKEMIGSAQRAGCDCVKFQSWSADSLYSKTYYQENPIAKRFVDKFSFEDDQLLELARYSRSAGIAFASTPYARHEVDFLAKRCDAPYIKIASMELNNYPYLEYIGKTGIPIVLSTGMGEMEEIKKAVAAIENTGNRSICILHCVSVYPVENASLRLNNILGLRATFPDYPIGFSDHSIGTEMATAAVALGACLIEKHFTLDRSRIGMDNQMATEPQDMARMVTHCRSVQQALGGTERIVSQQELDQRKKMRRSVVAARTLAAGTVLSKEDLDSKRPGTGLPPEKIYELVGKMLLRDIDENTLITMADIAD